MAIDPGEKIGWATAELNDRGKVNPRSFKHGITDLKSFALRLFVVYERYDVVIMESWRLSATHAKHLVGSTMPTVQFIGMVRLLSWQHPDVTLIEQAPSVKATALKTMAKGKPDWHAFCLQAGAHDDTHDHDAVMHLWYWIWRTYV